MLAWLLLRVKVLILVTLASVLLTSTKACREDYFFATQANVADIATATPTPDEDDDFDDDDDLDLTPTPTVAVTVSVAPTVIATVAGTVTATTPPEGTATSGQEQFGLSLLRQLEQASEPEEPGARNESDEDDNPEIIRLTPAPGQGRGASNWLGNMYDGEGSKNRLLYALAPNSRQTAMHREFFGVLSEIGSSAEVQGGTYSQFFTSQYANFNPDVIVIEWARGSAQACDMLEISPASKMVVLGTTKAEVLAQCEVGNVTAVPKVTRAAVDEALREALGEPASN